MRKSSLLAQAQHSGSVQTEERGGGRKRSVFPMTGGRHASPHVMDASRMRKQQGGVRSGVEGRDPSVSIVQANLEPTYRMEPDKKFYAPQVHNIIKETLEKHLDGFQFNPKFTGTMTKVLSDDLKDRVKQLGWERYKLITNVIMGQRLNQGLVITSRCAWDVRLDSYAAYTYQNKSLFCTASVYGIYCE